MKNLKLKIFVAGLLSAMIITLLPTSFGANAEDIEIFNISVSAKTNTASISWYTSQSVKGELKYGLEYLGARYSISSDTKTDLHRFNLSDLLPDTTYKYEAIALDRNGNITAKEQGQFKTLKDENYKSTLDNYCFVNFNNKSFRSISGEFPAQIKNLSDIKLTYPSVNGYALQMDSNDAELIYATDRTFALDPYNKAFQPNAGSVAVWLRIEKFNKDMVVWETNDSSYALYLENFSNFSRLVARVGGNEAKYTFDYTGLDINTWKLGEWHYVVMTWNGRNNGTLEIYVDGRRRDSVMYEHTDLPISFMIGNNYRNDMAWANGQIDNFQLYNWTMVHSFIAQQYNNSGVNQQKDLIKGYVAGVQVRKFTYGKLFKTSNNKIYVVTRDNQVLHVSDLNALKRYKSHPIITDASYDEADQFTTAGEFYSWSRYPDGTLLKGSNKTVYWLWDNEKRPIADESVFNRYGNDWADIITVSDAELNSYSTGFTYY